MIIFSSSLPKSSRAKMKEKSSFVYIILVFVPRIFRHDIAEIYTKIQVFYVVAHTFYVDYVVAHTLYVNFVWSTLTSRQTVIFLIEPRKLVSR
jgi:hypothetical protein